MLLAITPATYEIAILTMRYAIYFAADADDRLMQLGNHWLGRDPFTGKALTQPALDGLEAGRFESLTTDPRRYGFHGTLKAPFALKDGQCEADLVAACQAFAAEIAPFDIQGLNVNPLGRFLALTPDRPETGLSAFAALCVRRFEPFRAPLSDADLDRRRKSGLSPKLDAYMTTWGYPYIFDAFRFHMTLSNKLEDDTEAGTLARAAGSHFAEVTGRPRTCGHFALYTEEERGAPFEVHTVFQLSGSAAPEAALARAEAITRKETA